MSGYAESNETSYILTAYDFPPYGLNNGKFIALHTTALTCLSISLSCAIAVLIVQFRKKKAPFHNWGVGERFVVYQALCDGTTNISHCFDHVHMLIIRDHVTPPVMCKIYGAILGYVTNSQMLTALFISIHAYLVICHGKSIPFGPKDRNFLLFVYIFPVVFLIIGISMDLYGPSGAFCFTDLTKPMAFLGMLVVPASVVCALATILYTLTWLKILKKTHEMKAATSSTRESAATIAAKKLTLFVAAFLAQWTMAAVFGIMAFASPPPPDWANFLMTTLANLGGFFNMIVYIIIRRK